jgi:tetratricopeptide (TPR) repeat protein
VGYWAERVRERTEKVNKVWDPEAEVDLSAALAHAQKYDDALKHAQAAERARPGMYATAANIGTLYELKGDVPHALSWIKEGVNRNPFSLHATEWLHIRILEAKEQLAKDPNWLASHSVLGMDFGSGAQPVAPSSLPAGNRGKAIDLNGIEEAVNYQLHERLEFVAAPDPVVADLLGDLGNMLALRGDKEDAKDIYELALKYGPAQTSLIQTRLDWTNDVHNYLPLEIMFALGLIGYGAWRWKSKPREEPLPIQQLDEALPERPTGRMEGFGDDTR